MNGMKTGSPGIAACRSILVAAICTWLLLPIGASAGFSDIVQVIGAWARETRPGQSVGAAYLRIRSKERLDLIRVESAASSAAELHQMSMADGIMKMREVKAVRIDPGREIELGPRGTHVMLVNLKRPLNPGDKVPLKLVFRRPDGSTGAVAVQARVRSIAAGEPKHAH